MGPQSADIAHPAFAKLFIETEYIVDLGAILATRRRRAPLEPEIWAAHVSVADGEAIGRPEFETDRARFLGRGHGVAAPIAMLDARPLTNSIGAVLDPIFSLRRRVSVPAGATVRVAFWTMAAELRAALLDCVDKHRDASAYERATTLAWTQEQVQLHHLGVTPGEAICSNDWRVTSSFQGACSVRPRTLFARVPARNPVCGLRHFGRFAIRRIASDRYRQSQLRSSNFESA